MLTTHNLSYFLGDRVLYQNINLHIKPKDKIGLIGANGTGKSTLLKIISNEYSPSEGTVSKSKECSIGFLNQDLLSFKSKDSILHVVMQAFERENKLHDEITAILQRLETEYTDDLIEKLGKKQEEFDILGGYSLQSKAEEILEGLGFKTEELEQALENFSGGWRMRVMLAKMLLQQPNLLLLDEPTNHLDMPSIEWLERYVNSYPGAVIVVSHDRTFLNNCINQVYEVASAQISTYVGNYDKYLEERELRREIQKSSFENQQKKIKETEAFIDRFRAKASKSNQVQSRIKALNRLDIVDDISEENRQINFKFNYNKPSGKVVLELKNISKAYGPKQILKNSTVSILKGDKIALIGANGKGKSTLLRILDGEENFEGVREEGHNVIKAMFAQHQLEDLNIENEIIQELVQTGVEKTELELRSVLGAFLFTNDEIFKKIKVLSGGERSRVALAKTLISEANFLLLDEPTNHLDIQSVNMLTQALDQYNGTFIVISHDRHFVSKVANKIWFIENYEIKEYPGTYEEFLIWFNKRKIEEKSTQETKKIEKPKVEKPVISNEDSKEKQRKIKVFKKDLEKCEAEIFQLEKTKTQLEEEMSQPTVFANVDLLREKNDALQKTLKTLETLNDKWAEIVESIELEENA